MNPAASNKKRSRLWLRWLLPPAALALLLAFVHAWFRWSPTGIEEVSRSNRAALARVEANMTKPVGIMRAEKSNEADAAASAAPQPIEFGSETFSNYEWWGGLSPSVLLPMTDLRRDRIASYERGERNGDPGSAGHELPEEVCNEIRRVTLAAVLESATGSATSAWRRKLEENGFYTNNGGSGPAVYRDYLRKGIDNIEQLLIHRGWKRTPFEHGYLVFRDSSFLGIGQWAKCAIIRTLLQGDAKKAEALWLASLELWLQFHLLQFPYGTGDQPSIVTFAGLPSFSEDALVRAGEMLDAARLDDDDREAFRQAHIMRMLDTYMAQVDNGSVVAIPNSWHFFLDGKLERTTQSFFQPMLRKSADRLAAAWLKGDEAAISEAIRDAERARRLMNISLPPFVEYGPQRIKREGGNIEINMDVIRHLEGRGMNSMLALNRIIIALARYHRSAGSWPVSLNELTPAYLPSIWLNDPDSRWLLFSVEAPQSPEMKANRERLHPAFRGNVFDDDPVAPILCQIDDDGICAWIPLRPTLNADLFEWIE